MELNIIDTKPLVKSVAVITPTIGSAHLKRCMSSVRNQKFDGVLNHYVVVDGKQHTGEFFKQLSDGTEDTSPAPNYKLTKVFLDENVGGKGWYGHRVYAAFSFLFNEDAVCFLDEDNWFDPDHVQTLVDTLNDKGYDWTFSFRKIYDKDGNYLFEDNCESLGIHPVYCNDQLFHVDTSSYLVRKEIATRVGGAWYGQWGADRQYFGVLCQHFQQAGPSRKHTLCYRLDGNPGSVSKEFFEQGNEAMKKRYGDNLPWMHD